MSKNAWRFGASTMSTIKFGSLCLTNEERPHYVVELAWNHPRNWTPRIIKRGGAYGDWAGVVKEQTRVLVEWRRKGCATVWCPTSGRAFVAC
jgi:hypothetical protein